MFKQTAIFYITKSSVFLVSKQTPLQKLDIKPFVVGQEVLDIAAFVKSLSSFIVSFKIKNAKTLIAIDESLTYEKEILEKEKTQQILDQFCQELPFENKKLEIANLKMPDKNILIATNKYIYQPLVQTLRQNGNEVQFVIPAKYVPLREADLRALSFEDLQSKITTATRIQEISFKQDEFDPPKFVQTAAQTSPTNLQGSAQSKTEKSDADPKQPDPRKHPELFKYLLFAFFGLTATAVFIYIAIKGLTR